MELVNRLEEVDRRLKTVTDSNLQSTVVFNAA